ncbi:MAG: ABC transporter substrate-binding protein [Acidimicrobiales bacterium]
MPPLSAPAAAPILIGVLYDFPQGDGGEAFETAIRLGLDDVAGTGRIDRPVELVSRHVSGLPSGTAHGVEGAFADLVATGVLAVVGPSISDNGLIVGPLADAAGIPCINYTGGERTRGEFMFHYQVGSLEEEPGVLAGHLDRRGLSAAAVVHDNSPVGRRYVEFLIEACAGLGIEILGTASISPLAEDVTPAVSRLRTADPSVLVYLGLGVTARAVSLAVERLGWKVPVVANSSLMFGYARPDWRDGWEGWVYVDGVSDDNTVRARLKERSPRSAAGPVGVAAYDIGRLLGEAIARAGHLTREGIRDGLERIKQLPASSGLDGTIMGFGHWDHAALKGHYLVLRRWEGGRTVQVAPG